MGALRRLAGRLVRAAATSPGARATEERRLRQLAAVLREIPVPGGPISGRPVVIGPLRQGHLIWACLGVVLAHMFRLQGRDGVLWFDDGQYPYVDTVRTGLHSDRSCWEWLAGQRKLHLSHPGRGQPPGRGHRRCLKVVHECCVSPSPRITTTSDILRDRPLDLDQLRANRERIAEGELSPNTLATHRRFFGGRPFDPSNRRHRTLAELSIKAEVIARQAAGWLVDRYDPAGLIMLDGIYAFNGALRETLRDLGVPLRVFQPNGFEDRMMFIGENPFVIENDSPRYREYVLKDSKAHLQRADAMLHERTRTTPTREDENLLQRIRQARSRGQRVIGAFPNLTWDAALCERDTLFGCMGDWLRAMIEWTDREDAILVLREHPQSKSEYNRWESTLSWLDDVMPGWKRSPHVWAFSGRDAVSSFAFAPELDCSVVYSSTIGPELSYLGCPVIFAGQSPYYGMGVGYDPDDPDEFYRLISQLAPDQPSFVARRDRFRRSAVRAVAYHLIENAHYCPILPTVSALRKRGIERYWSPWDLTVEQMDPQRNPRWERTINRLLDF